LPTFLGRCAGRYFNVSRKHAVCSTAGRSRHAVPSADFRSRDHTVGSPAFGVAEHLSGTRLTLGGLGGCLVFSARLAQQLSDTAWTADERRWLYAIGALVSWTFVFASVASQNHDMVVVLLILVGLVCPIEHEPRLSRWPASPSGCAAKAAPLVFLPYLLFKRHYRAAASDGDRACRCIGVATGVHSRPQSRRGKAICSLGCTKSPRPRLPETC
jgi:hypothetical protein